jgi:hypothetical protein
MDASSGTGQPLGTHRSRRRREKRRRSRPLHGTSTKSGWRELLDPQAPSARILRTAWASRESQAVAAEARQAILAAFPRLIDLDTREELAGVVDPSRAWGPLVNLHEAIVTRLRDLVADHGSAEWLWFLRRLRGQFHMNELATTDPYVQALAEALSAGHSRPSTPYPGSPRFAFSLNEKMLYHLHWISQVARIVYRLHGTMKRCAKGQPVIFEPGGIPQAAPHAQLEAAIELYDRRTERVSANLLQAVGVVGPDRWQIPSGEGAMRIGGLVPTWTFIPSRRAPIIDKADPPPAFIQWIDLDGLPLAADDVLTNEHVALIALLWACLNIATRDPDKVQQRMSAPLQWGYMVTPTKGFLIRALDEIASWLPKARGAALPTSRLPTNGADIVAALEGMEPIIWPPLIGNPIHAAGEFSLVDLVGASYRLYTTLIRPTDGADVNYWSQHFERDVQELIDRTPWRPEGDVRELIGRTIHRADRSALTDIDAVGHREGRLLLISCKSIAFTLPVLRGEHAVTRNILERVHAAAQEWRSVIEYLRADPSRLGIRIPPHTRMDGCVVFPAVPFFTDRLWRRDVIRGLPYLSSSEELREALGRP